MKNGSIWSRARASLSGLRQAWQRERSLRTQVALFVAALAILMTVDFKPLSLIIWLMTATVAVAFELVNAAIETLADRLHPEMHAEIGAAKDMASAAAFVANCLVGALFGWLLLCGLDV